MSEAVARMVLTCLGAYGALGLAMAPMVHARLATLDPAAQGAGVLFRALITPGIIALWPLLLARMRRARRGGSFVAGPPSPQAPATLRRAHRVLAATLAVLVPLLIATALALRPAPPRTGVVPARVVGR